MNYTLYYVNCMLNKCYINKAVKKKRGNTNNASMFPTIPKYSIPMKPFIRLK